MLIKGTGPGKILEEQFLRVTWGEAVAAWWADRPRRTWIVAPHTGLYGVFFDLHDADEERKHQNAVLGPGNECRFSVVKPGPWLRPSQMAALETYHGNGIDRRA